MGVKSTHCSWVQFPASISDGSLTFVTVVLEALLASAHMKNIHIYSSHTYTHNIKNKKKIFKNLNQNHDSTQKAKAWKELNFESG